MPVRGLFFALLVIAGLFFALAPGTLSPLAPLADDWVSSLDHRLLVILAHLLGYAGLVMMLTWVWGRLLPAAVVVFLFSIAVESAQALLPWREGSLGDVALNFAAVWFGAALAALLRGLRRLVRD